MTVIILVELRAFDYNGAYVTVAVEGCYTIAWLKVREIRFSLANTGMAFHASNLFTRHFPFDHRLIGRAQFVDMHRDKKGK